ncbi:hypothetical protein AX768_13430 [Burkholderia sp. PAMC 28687]|uniref:terminase small subunit-like protein n=1 Tax=Burkholderia sp. PAMC 28687 TaxID=1795874 RepID=UPI000784338F|nr:hypothetical protein [Burkholderia sp. PAMC 28687]AMM14951.1 hypothetical protein AX768_13430 [Burkholderia sp. PAMC 28687]
MAVNIKANTGKASKAKSRKADTPADSTLLESSLLKSSLLESSLLECTHARANDSEKILSEAGAGAGVGAVARKKIKTGRPRKYDRAVLDAVLTAVANGMTLTKACAANPAWPTRATVYAWIQDDPALKARYETALEFQFACWGDQIIDIPDAIQVGDHTQTAQDGTRVKIKTSDKIAKAKLQALVRLQVLGKLSAKYRNIGNTSEDAQTFRVLNSPDLDGDGEA